MSERLNSPDVDLNPEATHSEWYDMSEMPEYGYWFGASYNGTYHNRLQVNLPHVEKVCRFLDIASVSLKSESWRPPAPQEPEAVSWGLAALKKFRNPFGGDESEDTTDSTPYRIAYSHLLLEENLAACTYDVRIRDSLLDYQVEEQNLNASKSEREAAFVGKFNGTFWSALHRISRLEDHGARHENVDWRSLINLIGHVGSAGLMSVTSDLLAQTEGIVQLLGEQAVRGGSRLGVGAMRDRYYYKKYPIEMNGETYYINARTPARAISDIWRLTYDPVRFKAEQHESSVLARQAARLAPYGLLFEDHYMYGLARAASGTTPFFRLK
jgi:hypothetical protein